MIVRLLALWCAAAVCGNVQASGDGPRFHRWHFSGCAACDVDHCTDHSALCPDCTGRRQHDVWRVGCACGAAATSCCGSGITAWSVLAHRQPVTRLTGYEGLPQMDGGGVHYRYPYHSYRRPWFHPGPASVNVTICW